MRLSVKVKEKRNSKSFLRIAVPSLVIVIFLVVLKDDPYGHTTLDFPAETMLGGVQGQVLGNNSRQLIGGEKLPYEEKYRLAFDQSLGYFDDFPEHQWKRAQEIHAKMFPNHAVNLNHYSNAIVVKDKMKELARSKDWYSQNFHEEFHCPLAQRVPIDGAGDGPKWICDPHRLRTKKDCLVYSIGSNGKAEFEKGVKDEIGENCEIHTFDTARFNRRFGDFEKALEGYSTFHHWGLGTAEEAQKNPKRFKTLGQTMQELGHAGRRIDLFKIDCEWCEWHTYDEWLKQDLRQILIETHNAPMPNAKNFFYALHDAGYVIFNKEANYVNGAGGVEYGFFKMSTDFFINNTMYSKRT